MDIVKLKKSEYKSVINVYLSKIALPRSRNLYIIIRLHTKKTRHKFNIFSSSSDEKSVDQL